VVTTRCYSCTLAPVPAELEAKLLARLDECDRKVSRLMCAFIPARANSSSGAPAAAESSAPASRARLSDRDHWLTAGQFLNAVALGQVTLGPVVQTVAVVGYSAAGIGGGLLAALVAFSPSFAFVLLGAQRFDRLRTNENAKTFLNGAGPAAIGAILGTAIPLARALSEPWQYGILAAAFALLLFARSGVVRTLPPRRPRRSSDCYRRRSAT